MDPGPSSDPRPSGQGDSDSSCSASKRICRYDVFISFRGPDTRNSFTDHLYDHLTRKGILAFKDDKRLKKGQRTSSQLIQAIKDSRVSIVVFSEGYADSTWCLEEMATIADCKRDLKQIVFPIFYDVEPSFVRYYHIGAYKDAFLRHSSRNDASKVDRWKSAMTDLAKIVGYDVRNKSEVREIEKIVQAVIKSLDHRFSGHVHDLIGLRPRVRGLENLLKLSSEDDGFRVLGIWGMGGIGKTTLATVLYDRISYLFDGSCFIENVSQDYKAGGAIAVQKQILRQTLDEKNLETCSPSEISRIVRNRLHRRKVLLVLDNVDELEQLEKLAISPELLYTGSRIIITTRNEHILKVYGANAVYEVPLLNEDDAHELFCTKAFKSDDIGGRFVELISEVLKYTQGLPLAIRVVGSSLCTRNAIHWRDTLDRLRNNPNNQIMDVLQVSFDGLEINEKEIFLHIACFFKGEREDYVKRILDCCELYPHIGIKVLNEKALITIRNQEILMHDMMQQLGKKIVQGEFSRDPRTWSRLWLYKDFHHALTLGMGINQIKAVVLDGKKDLSKVSLLHIEELSQLRDLELLILPEIHCSGRLHFLSNNLRFLLWDGYPFTYLPSDFQPDQLAELNMSNSKMLQLWEGIKNLPCLKRLDLSNSRNLMETPNFEGIPNLERLDLTGCINLLKVHPSIGLLKELAFLSLQNCCSLVGLYLDSVSKLSSLRVLFLSGCTNLESTPDFTGMLELEYLDLEQCISLSMIHESIGALVKLKFLSLRNCTNLVSIPNSVNTMISLETLDLSNCLKLMNLPLGQRSELEDAIYLGLVGFVPIGCLGSVIILDLGFCNLCEVPDAIGGVWCLERLNLQGNHIFSLPDTICLLYRLAYLNLSYCHELQYLPLLPSNNGSKEGGMYFKKVSGSRNHRSGLYMFDCPKLVESGLELALAWLTKLVEKPDHFRCGFDIVVTGTIIPDCFNHQFIRDSVIRIVQSEVDDYFIGFAFCVAFEINFDQAKFDSSLDSASSSSSSPPSPHPLYLSFESENTEEIFGMQLGFDLEKSVGSKHLWLIYISRPHCHFVKTGAHITFKACPGLEIRKWGIRMIFKQDIVSKLLITGEGNQRDHFHFDYVSETQRWRSSWPKVQLPYNWLVVQEEENENMEAKQKENNISRIGLGRPLFPSENWEELQVQPEEVLAGRLDKQGNPELLVKWKGMSACENSWELLEKFQEKFSDFHLEDKVVFEGERVDEDLEPSITTKVYVRKRLKKRGTPEDTSGGDALNHHSHN